MLMAKLGFLKHVMSKGADDLCGRVVLSLCNNFDSSCLVRECTELEEPFGTGLHRRHCLQKDNKPESSEITV